MHSLKKAQHLLTLALVISTVLMGVKFLVFWRTGSNAVLSDAMESIINVAAQVFAIFSLRSASKPGDKEHLYGHGKFEFLSAGFEGALILIAGVGIIIRSCFALVEGQQLNNIDEGILIAGTAGVINGLTAWLLISQGKKLRSDALRADGQHLFTDTITSLAMVAGLVIVYATGMIWIDAVISMLFALIILFTGYRLVRLSLGRLLDETDMEKVDEIIESLQSNRKQTWIDIHEFRLLKFGNILHIDCHITLPYYMSIREAHIELEAIEQVIAEGSVQPVEVYMHTDPCRPGNMCGICCVENCPVRQMNFIKQIKWERDILLKNEQHKLV